MYIYTYLYTMVVRQWVTVLCVILVFRAGEKIDTPSTLAVVNSPNARCLSLCETCAFLLVFVFPLGATELSTLLVYCADVPFPYSTSAAGMAAIVSRSSREMTGQRLTRVT